MTGIGHGSAGCLALPELSVRRKHSIKSNHCAIEIENLGVNYAGRRVLRDFSLRVAAGEKVSLTGPSGSGKSTVLKCILGLVEPREGSIRVLGTPIAGDSVWEARRNLAYVAQEPELGAGSVRQALERPFAFKANAALRGNQQRLTPLLKRFNLDPALLDKESTALSGGEKQRIALILAVLLDRPIMLLDEASSALDPNNKQAVVDFIREADDLTVLSVAHDAEWLGFADRVVNLAGDARETGDRP
jgi:putative ABC transport system ATP-binding protein